MNKETIIENLSEFKNKDHFGPDNFLYSGIQDPALKRELEYKFQNVIADFEILIKENGDSSQLLELLRCNINRFDRETLDTEDAENIAAQFEKTLDYIRLESSEGILNDWMYGFDPELI